MFEPLNKILYEKLCRYYDGQVDVVAPGEAITWRIDWIRDLATEKLVPIRKVISSGEEYKVRCKRCLDHRARLQINHMWGVWDEESDSNNLWLAQCWNEQCYSEYQHQKWLFDSVYALGVLGNRQRRQTINVGRIGKQVCLRKVDPPGTIYRLDQLAEKMPGHPALTYLTNRGFDPIKLAKLWGVGYCGISRIQQAMDRIYIPVHMKGMLVGYQTRYIGDDVNGVPFNKAKVAKYWTAFDMPRRLVLYNIERAVRHKTLVLVEGPADAWNIGPMCTAILGKTLNPQHIDLIVDGMKQHGDEGVVVVMLDPKQDKKDIERNKPHHIERAVDALRKPLGRRVVPVYLPEDYDPGSMEREWCRAIMREAAAKMGMNLSFARPTA